MNRDRNILLYESYGADKKKHTLVPYNPTNVSQSPTGIGLGVMVRIIDIPQKQNRCSPGTKNLLPF